MKVRKKIIFSSITTVIFFLILEFFLHIIGYDCNPFENTFRIQVAGELFGTYDNDLFWKLENMEPDFEEKNKLKIICLTDSTSVMYERMGYPDLLQSILNKRIPEKNPVVFNAGIPGYTSYQGLKYLKTKLLSYNPDIIIVCYGVNDHWKSENGLPDKLQKGPKKNIITNISNELKIYGLVSSLIMKYRQFRYNPTKLKGSNRVPLIDYKKNIYSFSQIAQKNGILLILMTAPYLNDRIENINDPQDWKTTHTKYNNVIRQTAIEEKIPLVDLVNVFSKRKELFINPETDKIHYNWKGSQIVAQTLANKIIRELKIRNIYKKSK